MGAALDRNALQKCIRDVTVTPQAVNTPVRHVQPPLAESHHNIRYFSNVAPQLKMGKWRKMVSPCAVTRRLSSAGVIPDRQLSLQPVASGAALAVTRSPKPSMQRTARRSREPAGRNVSER